MSLYLKERVCGSWFTGTIINIGNNDFTINNIAHGSCITKNKLSPERIMKFTYEDLQQVNNSIIKWRDCTRRNKMKYILEVLPINEFIQRTKKEPLKYTNYCEILLDPYGRVIIFQGCHADAAMEFGMAKEGLTREHLQNEIINIDCLPLEWFVDKYKLVAIWYCGYMHPSGKLNRFQQKSIDLLIKNNLIQQHDLYIQEATAYTQYLKSID